MTRIIDEAIRAGKLLESRRDYYEQLYAQDPKGTVRVLELLPVMSPPQKPRILAGGLFDESRMAIEFQDTEVSKGGVRPALGSRQPAGSASPAVAEPLPWFETRPHRRITYGG